MEKFRNITILCSVIDNYGDIGFVYRLSRSLSLQENVKLRLVVSDLKSFSAMAPGIDCSKKIQEYNGWKVLDWNAEQECTSDFLEDPPCVVLQCFQCGRPDWLDRIMFAPEQKNIIHIINVEYLTAEDWADDFHLLKSGTRSAFVKKVNFMPGFTSKTGGLVLDKPFMDCLKDKNHSLSLLTPYLSPSDMESLSDPETFCSLVFSYPRDFTGIVEGFNLFYKKQLQSNPDFRLQIFAARGAGLQSFKEAMSCLNPEIKVTVLPYLPQESWDGLLTLMDFLFVRGEDSFARACLCSVPFMWHVYPQDEGFEIVKLCAVLNRLKPYLTQEDFESYAGFSIAYNERNKDEWGEEARKNAETFNPEDIKVCPSQVERLLTLSADKKSLYVRGFNEFAASLIKNGDLASKLLLYLKQLQF